MIKNGKKKGFNLFLFSNYEKHFKNMQNYVFTIGSAPDDGRESSGPVS